MSMHYITPPHAPACAANEPSDPKTNVSPVMLALVKVRFHQYLHLAVGSLRAARDETMPVSSRIQEAFVATRMLGIAIGQAYALYDTEANAYRYLRVTRKIQYAIEALLVTILDPLCDDLAGAPGRKADIHSTHY